jgi:hypothetical protein
MVCETIAKISRPLVQAMIGSSEPWSGSTLLRSENPKSRDGSLS